MKRSCGKLNLLISCGATREPIDPARFISNYSTGFFGCEIAREAKRRSHHILLVKGQVMYATPPGLRSIDVQTAHQMQEKLKSNFAWCDCLIMTAAVCDFRPAKLAKAKIKRTSKGIALRLEQNPDILKSLARKKGKRMIVGFALETENLSKNALGKLRKKNLDLIVATQMKNTNPFGRAKLDTLIIDREGRRQKIRQATKRQLSQILLDWIEKTKNRRMFH